MNITQHRVTNITASIRTFSLGPSWARANAGAATLQRQQRGTELLGTQDDTAELGQTVVWANQHSSFFRPRLH
eukprot:1137953-Pelagomonas_calceolata.AAC.3